MATPLLSRQTQVLVEKEATLGTAESLTSADGGIRLVDGSDFEHGIESEDRNIVTGSLSNIGSLVGAQAGNITIISEINTPDTITDAIEYADSLEACGMSLNQCKVITVSSVSGTFKAGETVTGGTSSATGKCAIPVITGDTKLYLYSITGTFQNAETVTGGTSTATATTGSTASNHGWAVLPISDSQVGNTVEMQKDGFAWSIKGAMANLEISSESSKRGLITFSYTGVKGTWGDKSMTTGITYNTETPPILENARAKLDTYTVVLHSVNFNLNNEVVLRPDGNAEDNGYISAYIAKRKPTVSMTLEFALAADFDFYTKFADSTKFPIQFRIGSASTKMFWLTAGEALITNLSQGNADGIATIDVEMELTGTNNNEFILFWG